VTTGFSWKGIDMNILFQGTDHVSNYYANPFMPTIANAARVENVYDAWTEEKYLRGDKILYPRLSVANAGANFQQNSFMNLDASFFRIKNVEIGYTLPRNISNKLYCSMLRVYTSGQNLATFSDMKYFDPETSRNTDRTYPVTRVINFGVKANF
jgi:hypothetical protein